MVRIDLQKSSYCENFLSHVKCINDFDFLKSSAFKFKICFRDLSNGKNFSESRNLVRNEHITNIFQFKTYKNCVVYHNIINFATNFLVMF